MLSFSSCGGPEADQKKLYKKIEKLTEVAKDAAEDKILDEKEIEEINSLNLEIKEIQAEIDTKYKDNKEAQKKIKNLIEEDKENISEIHNKLYTEMMRVYACKGGDKIKI